MGAGRLKGRIFEMGAVKPTAVWSRTGFEENIGDVAVDFRCNCQTARGCASAISRRDAPEACVGWPPSERLRGRRESRVRAAPAVSCAIVIGQEAHEHTG